MNKIIILMLIIANLLSIYHVLGHSVKFFIRNLKIFPPP